MDEVRNVSSAQEFSALGHPLRLRLLSELGQREETISQLAVALGTRKGNVAHHLDVLRTAGLVRLAFTRQVRGGTERYYERTARRLNVLDEGSGARSAQLLHLVADEVADATPNPFMVLRSMHLRGAEVERITAALTDVIEGIDEADASQPRYGVLVGLYEPRPAGAGQ